MQIDEVNRSKEIEIENLKRMEERLSAKPLEQENLEQENLEQKKED